MAAQRLAIVIVLVVLATALLVAPLRFCRTAKPALSAAAVAAIAAAGLAGVLARRPRQSEPKTATAVSAGRTRGGARGRAGGEWTRAEATAIKVAARGRLSMEALPKRVQDLGALPYRPAPPRRGSAVHIGQRKLLMSEVLFLTNHASAGDTVVYAGAAPGTHMPFLATLFRQLALRFELHDPRRFAPQLQASPEIETQRGFFTDATAQSYAGREDVLLISDIRTGLPSEPDVEQKVLADMRAQERWVHLMNPRACLLKMRPPYASRAPFTYLAGELWLQPWAPLASSETRLAAARPYGEAVYDPHDYENRMFYLNLVPREWARYDHGVPVSSVPGLNHHFDCAFEAFIWAAYLRRFGGSASPAAIAAQFNQALRAIPRPLRARAPRNSPPKAQEAEPEAPLRG